MVFRAIVEGPLGRRRQNARPVYPAPRFPLSFLLPGYSCARLDEHVSYGNMGDTVPPFGLAFSSAANLQDVLAVANEEGIVRIYNTESRDRPLLKEWLAHENAVFDVAWVPGEAQLVTAAGDQMARLWDVTSGELLGSFRGHLCSLKSVAFTPWDKAVLCTGARDGNIMVWDTRCTKKDGFYKPVKQISGAHNKANANSLMKTKRRRSNSRGMAPSVDTQQSVTVVLFQDQHTLISSGAVDGVVKMWDLRKSYSALRAEQLPLQTFPYPGSSLRTRLGYSGLVLDSTRSNVICNCTDDNIYMFNVSGARMSPVAVFSGHQNSSFYVRSSLSPDDQFLSSGSSDGNAFIWKVSSPSDPPMMLQGHSEEVTSVAWCPSDFSKIASCSDDHRVRVWRLRRGTEESSLGPANTVGGSRLRSPQKRFTQTETTPAKAAPAQSLGGLSSPRAAACASNSASLPLPSDTASPPLPSDTASPSPSPSVKPRPKTPTSLQKWLSPVNRAPSPQTCTAPPAEQRAKRRLEAGGASCCGEGEDCRCVVELRPTKRRRGACEGVDLQKENCCPTAGGNWLSAMGRRLRASPRTAPGGRPASSSAASPQRMKNISTYFLKRTRD